MAEREVLVVGAGVGGLTAALALAARGLAVRVLEAGPPPGGKAGTGELAGDRVETGPRVAPPPRGVADGFARAGPAAARVRGPARPAPGVWVCRGSWLAWCGPAPQPARPLGNCVSAAGTGTLLLFFRLSCW